MTASTEIVPFALGAGANVLDPTDYAALTSTTQGYVAGIAQSQQLNTTWRQSSFMAAALANFLVSQGITQNDDGNITGAVNNIQQAIKQLVGAPNVFTGGTTTGTVNAQVLATVIPSSGFALNNGYTVVATAGFTNTGSTTMNIASSGPITVQKLSGSSLVNLTGGEIVATDNFSITYNSTAGVWVLQTTPTLGALAFLGIGAGLAASGGNLITTSGVQSGTVLDFAGPAASIPSGYLLCNGQLVSRTTYATLFGIIGTTFGVGDGSTTFGLPDLRDMVTAGLGNMGGADRGLLTTASGFASTAVGSTAGNELVQAHTHGVADAGHHHTVTAAISAQNQSLAAGESGGSGTISNSGLNTSTATTGISITSYGSGGSQNVQPTMMLVKMIKT